MHKCSYHEFMVFLTRCMPYVYLLTGDSGVVLKSLNVILLSSMPRQQRLGCCEYTNRKGETAHILGCCCDCDVLDAACDR